VAAESSWAVFFRRSSLRLFQKLEVASRLHSDQQNLLSTYDGGTGTMSHLINGVERARQSRYK
jgi:hypothetical protein